MSSLKDGVYRPLRKPCVCFAEGGGYVNDRTDGLNELFLLATMPAKFSDESQRRLPLCQA